MNDILISEINIINTDLEKNENIKYYSSGRISLLNSKVFEHKFERSYYRKNQELCILDKDHFIISNDKESTIYKKELTQEQDKKCKTLNFTIKSIINYPFSNIVKLKNNVIAGIFKEKVYIYSFNNTFSSYKLEKQIEINNVNRINVFSNNNLILFGNNIIQFYEEINIFNYQKKK